MIEDQLPDSNVLVLRPFNDIFFNRPGYLYQDQFKHDFADNHDRFLFFGDLDGAAQFWVSHRFLVQTPEGLSIQ